MIDRHELEWLARRASKGQQNPLLARRANEITMPPIASIFLDFNLPNAATWFYLSLILVVGLFFKFGRFFSTRNFDILSLYLLVPGFLLLQEGNKSHSDSLTFFGYLWLTIGSLWFFARCLWDLTLVGRPAIGTNLNLAGLAWMAAALFACMVPIAARLPAELQQPVGTRTMALDVLDKASNQTVDEFQKQLSGTDHRDDVLTRFWVERAVALLCHLAVIAALVLIGAIHFQNTTAGMAAATLYMLLPYTAYHVGQAHHVFPAALLMWAIYCYRRAWLSGLFARLGRGNLLLSRTDAADLVKFLSQRGNAALHHGVCPDRRSEPRIDRRRSVVGRQFGRKSALGAASAGMATVEIGWPAFDLVRHSRGVSVARVHPLCGIYHHDIVLAVAEESGHLVALSAAALIGIQFWYADHGGEYVLWYLPLMVLMVFRPNLADRYPPPQEPLPTWPSRSARRIADWVANRIQPTDPAVKV